MLQGLEAVIEACSQAIEIPGSLQEMSGEKCPVTAACLREEIVIAQCIDLSDVARDLRGTLWYLPSPAEASQDRGLESKSVCATGCEHLRHRSGI